MLGIVYLILATYLGRLVLSPVLPRLAQVAQHNLFTAQPVSLSRWLVVLPASFLTGTLLMAWFTYGLAYLLAFTGNPLLFANLITFAVCGGLALYSLVRHKALTIPNLRQIREIFSPVRLLALYKRHPADMTFCILALLAAAFIDYYTFYIHKGSIYVAPSVHSDFGPHLAMIRSFSLGANYPTEYPHFPNGYVRYHFMFFFLCGNLEYLGLRLDHAFNLPSLLSLASFWILLYVVAAITAGRKAVGYIVLALLLFRSSFAFFTYAKEAFFSSMPEFSLAWLWGALGAVVTNTKWIGKTAYEMWGIWSLNVLANQRHFAFSLAVMMLVLLYVLPLFASAVRRSQAGTGSWFAQSLGGLRDSLFSREGWMPLNPKAAALMGVILGLTTFWNGAVVITVLLILAPLALMSRHRLEYLIIVVITGGLSFLESAIFMGTKKSALNLHWMMGVLAKEHTLVGATAYYIEAFGILPFVVAAAMFFLPRGARRLTLAFAMPLIVATVLLFTTHNLNNHKFVHASVMLLCVPVAYVLYRLVCSRNGFKIAMAAILLILLTISGFADLMPFLNINRPGFGATRSVNDPLIRWTLKHAKPDDLFLTDIYSTHSVLLAGRKLYYGWPYYAWAAGYDTISRENLIKELLSHTDPDYVKTMLRERNIRYVIIDDPLRRSQLFKLNESLFRDHFPKVYEDPFNHTDIYEVK